MFACVRVCHVYARAVHACTCLVVYMCTLCMPLCNVYVCMSMCVRVCTCVHVCVRV